MGWVRKVIALRFLRASLVHPSGAPMGNSTVFELPQSPTPARMPFAPWSGTLAYPYAEPEAKPTALFAGHARPRVAHCTGGMHATARGGEWPCRRRAVIRLPTPRSVPGRIRWRAYAAQTRRPQRRRTQRAPAPRAQYFGGLDVERSRQRRVRRGRRDRAAGRQDLPLARTQQPPQFRPRL